MMSLTLPVIQQGDILQAVTSKYFWIETMELMSASSKACTRSGRTSSFTSNWPSIWLLNKTAIDDFDLGSGDGSQIGLKETFEELWPVARRSTTSDILLIIVRKPGRTSEKVSFMVQSRPLRSRATSLR